VKNDTLIVRLVEYEVSQSGNESIITDAPLPRLDCEGETIILGRGNGVFQLGLQFDKIVRNGISRRHCMVFLQDGELGIKALDGSVFTFEGASIGESVSKPRPMKRGEQYLLFTSRFYKSMLFIRSDDHATSYESIDCQIKLENSRMRETASQDELSSVDEILQQLIQHRANFEIAMTELEAREALMLERLERLEGNDKHQSARLKQTMMLASLLILLSLSLKLFQIQSLSDLSNGVMAVTAVVGLVMSLKQKK
jgi:hypothetical protein